MIYARYWADGGNDVFGFNAIPGNQILITITHPVSGVIATGSTSAGACGGCVPTDYQYGFPAWTFSPGVVVTVDFGDGIVEWVEVVEITGAPDADTDLVTGTGPAVSWLHVHLHRSDGGSGIDAQVNASGVYTADFGAAGADIVPGDTFSAYYGAPNGHVVESIFWLPAPELQIEKQLTPGLARPGGAYLYQIRIWNNGNGEAKGVIISDTLPANTAYAADTSGSPVIDGGSVITWTLGAIPAYSYNEFFVALAIDADAPPQTYLDENCAGIAAATPGDPDPGNNWSCSGDAWLDDNDVGIGVNTWPSPYDAHPGQAFNFYIDYWSDGGAASGPVWLTDTLPASTTLVRWEEEWGWGALWTEVSASGGQLVLHAPAGIPGNMGGRIRLTLALDAAVPLGTRLTNRIDAFTAEDDHPDNNTAQNDAQASGPRYDLNVDKWFSWGVLVPGGQVHYDVNHWNSGNVAIQAWLTDTLPAGTAYQPGSSIRHEGQPFPPETVTGETIRWDAGAVPVNGGFGFGFTADIAGSVEPGAVLTNCITIGSAEPDSDPNRNTSCVAQQVFDHGPNLRVTKEHWWNGDGQLGYRIHFNNLGDESVSNIWITDTLPAGTAWDGWWHLSFDWSRLVTQSLSSDLLAWQFSELYPGDNGAIYFNANLDEPGMPLRWYTNTVEITLPPDDTNPSDNIHENVAFSGGEVRRAEMWLATDHADMWGEGVPGPVTITTPYTQVVVWGDPGCNGCWNTQGDIGPIWPGDTVIVEAGSGEQPVIILMPDPFDVAADSATNMVWGQIAGASNQQIQIEGYWSGGHRDIWTNAAGEYSVTYPDIPRGAEGHVRYQTTIDYAEVMFHRRFKTPDLLVTVDYSHEGVDGNYEPGHTGWVTVTNDTGAQIKATVEVTTAAWPWWNGGSGFSTHHHQWVPQRPDIAPGDWVHAALDNGYATAVQVGTINAELDVDIDKVSGTLDVPWYSEGLLVRCEIHIQDAPSIEVYNVDPNGGAFLCDFGGAWDITPGQPVAVNYTEPDGDRVQFRPANPAPRLRVEKWLDGGNPGQGGNAVFTVQYRNEGDADAESVVITDTLAGMIYLDDTSGFAHTGSGGQVVWDLGTVAPGDWVQFSLFTQVNAAAGERVTNTVEIVTSNPYDQGDEWEKRSEWSGEVQPNDTYLNVGKWAWTGDPAAGYDVIFSVNVCNFGSTASAAVVLTDTLHLTLTLQSWWAQHPGWLAVSQSDHELVVMRPAIPGGWCSEVYVRATVDADAAAGTEIWNQAAIYAANDLSSGDDETEWYGNVNTPHANLYVEKQWGWGGQLVPGGQLRYNINVGSLGNIPVGAFRITDTLPANTSFVAAWQYDQNGQHAYAPVLNEGGVVVWEEPGLDNGYWRNFDVVLQVAQDAQPGALLVNTVEVTRSPDEDSHDDNVSTWTETLFDHGPNLRVVKWGGWHNDRPGHAWYNFSVQNVGDAPITQAVVTDTYPALMALEGGVNTDWSRVAGYSENAAEHWFAFTLNDVHPGYRLDFNFNTNMVYPVPSGLILTNTVAAAPVAGDTHPDDNTTHTILTTGPDLFVEKTLIGGELRLGELVTFSLRFGNDQPGHTWWWDMQGNAILTDTLPVGLEYVRAKQRWCGWSDWCERDPDRWEGDQAVWDLWPIHVGEWNELYVTVLITDTAAGLAVLTNEAEIASSEPGPDSEPNYVNNHAALDLVLTCPLDMNGDGQVDVLDIQDVAGRWQATSAGGPPYHVRYDVAPPGAPDGIINIADIQRIAAAFMSCP